MNVIQRLFSFVRPYSRILLFSFVLLFVSGLCEIATTALVIPLFDKVLTPLSGATSAGIDKLMLLQYMQYALSLISDSVVTQIAVGLIGLTLLKAISLYYSHYSMCYVGQSVVNDIRAKLFANVLGQSMAFFSLNSTGRLMSRMSSDVEQVQEAVSSYLGDLFREVILLVSLMVWIFYIDWRLAAISLLIAPLVLTLTLTMGKRVRRVSLRSREDTATLNDQLQQSITGMRIIKAFGMEGHEEARFRANSFKLFKSNLKAAAILLINSPLMEFVAIVAFIPVLYYAHAHISDGTLTLGMFGGSLFSLFRMYDPIRKLSRIHVQFQRALASGSRIMELLETHLEISDRAGARPLNGIHDSIEFRGVSFDYVDENGGTSVLRDINLTVRRNQVVALVGSSGSGKTTMAGLIPRFHDPTAGAVLIDGTDIREFTQGSLRRQIAMVTQDTFLFNDTVRNNIAYGDMNAPESRVVEAAKAALADDFIRQFPMGYATVIGERGQRLSGGERQRLSIARALLRNAPILILDEATSALDSESEQLVQEALGNLMRDRTTLVIAHRLSTIRNADLILVLERGRIVESGNHETLLAQDGPYRKFFRLQNEGGERQLSATTIE